MSIFDRAPEIVETLADMQEAIMDDCTFGRLRCKDICAKKQDCVLTDVQELIRALQSELARATAERDAAVADLKHGDNCDICKHNNTAPEGCDFDCVGCELDGCGCNKCRNESNWEWRGMQGDNNG